MTPLETRWNQLLPDPERPVFQLVDSDHPLQFYIGRGPSGERLLLLVTREKPIVPGALRSVALTIYPREDGNWSLVISLGGDDLSHVFAMLCADLIEAGRHVPDRQRPVAFVLRRLASWQRLLERGTSDSLSAAEIRGLVGELTFLRDTLLPRVGPLEAVQMWVGPLGADQDFQAPGAAWEVKTVRSGAETIRIASERQLWAMAGELHLVAICLEECAEPSSATFNLNSLVASVIGHLAADLRAVELFEDRLREARYLSREDYGRPEFRVAWTRAFHVHDQFPRLVRGELPEGVSSVRYEVELEACEPYAVQLAI